MNSTTSDKNWGVAIDGGFEGFMQGGGVQALTYAVISDSDVRSHKKSTGFCCMPDGSTIREDESIPLDW